MAKLHVATLSPSKPELLTQWLANDPYVGDRVAGGLEVLGAYRFDDPAGDVGLECHLLGCGDGTVLHVPVSYRAAAEPSLADHQVGSLEHSVLGTRWVYDGCADPVFVGELLRTMHTGDTQVELVVHTDDGPVIREPNAEVTGTGSAAAAPTIESVAMSRHEAGATVEVGAASVEVRRVLDLGADSADGVALLGTWTTQSVPVVLATA
jgi:hypothetical protein